MAREKREAKITVEGERDSSPKKGKADKQKAAAANFVLSTADPQVASLLESKIAPRVPKWVRHPAVTQLSGNFRSVVETVTDGRHWALKAAGEKASDYLDMLFVILGLKQGRLPTPSGPSTPTTSDRWEKRQRWADQRIQKSRDPDATLQEVRSKMGVWKKTDRLFDQASGRQVAPPPEVPEEEREPIDWKTKQESVKKSVKKKLYGTNKKPGPIPKGKEKAHRADVRVAWTLRGMNRRLEGWLEERGG